MTESVTENKILSRAGNRVTVRVEDKKGNVTKRVMREITTAKRFDTDSEEAQRSEKMLIAETPEFRVADSAYFLNSKVSAEKHKLHMDMLLQERLDAQKYGRRCRSLQELWAANKQGVSKAFKLAEALNPWQTRGAMVPIMNWRGPKDIFGRVQPIKGGVKHG